MWSGINGKPLPDRSDRGRYDGVLSFDHDDLFLRKEKLDVDTLDAQTRFSIRLYCYGTLGMTREWLMKDNITPAETVVRLMFASMPESLRTLYF